MYNEDIKARYINEKSEQVNIGPHYFPSLFRRTEPYEVELGKDISNFTSAEIENFFKTEDYVSLGSIAVDGSQLARYTDWCMGNLTVADSQNHFLEFSRTRLATFLNKNRVNASIITRQTVLRWVSELDNPSDAFLIYALFCGIAGDNFSDIWKLKATDIDIDDRKIFIHSIGEKLEYPIVLCELAKESAETETYRTMTRDMAQVRRFAQSDLVIKNALNSKDFVDDFRQGRRIYTKLVRIYQFFGVDDVMTARSLIDSGMINMVKDGAATYGISATEYLRKGKEEIGRYYGDYQPAAIIEKYGDILGR